MYIRTGSNLIGVINQCFSRVLVQQERYKITVSKIKFFAKTHALITRNYNDANPNEVIFDKYKQMDEEKLKQILQVPKTQLLFDKYKLEIEFERHFSGKVPTTLTASNWLHILNITSKGQRRKYIEFLWKIQKKNENSKRKKEVNQILRKEKEEEGEEINDQYQLSKCTMFYRIRTKTINHFYNSRLINAMMYEPTVVFDLGYENDMQPSELLNCAKQLLISFSLNRTHDEPFNLYFCNTNRDGIIMQRLHTIIPQIFDIDYPLNITSKSYLEVFDKDKLIYLTPDGQQSLKKFDPNCVYIIGAMVDKLRPTPLSFQKAKKENITTMRFPLETKLAWGTGSRKDLPLNQVLSILLDLKHTNDWNVALKHVPVRKLKPHREKCMEQKYMYRNRLLQNMKD